MSMSDIAARAEALQGRESPDVAVPLLVDAYGAQLYSLGLRLCGKREEAEDLVQETFLLAFRKWSQFEGRSKPSTWLYTIATRVCRKRHRKRAGEPRFFVALEDLLPLEEPEMGVVPSEDVSAQVQANAQLAAENAIAALPVIFRMPFVMKEVVGLTLAECSSVLGIKETTVKTRVHRARLRIRNAVEATLPRAEVAAPVYSKQVCLDLLRAKQEALDRGVEFRFPEGMVCERCAELFKTLDLAEGACRTLAHGPLPEELRRRLLGLHV
jgi:RNA polymerase sigma-70 factor (ECF subfamily)